MPTILLCPGCHRQIKTDRTELPAKITCPGCAHVAESSLFVKYEPPKIPNEYAADVPPIPVVEASNKPVKTKTKQASQLDIMFDVRHTRTASYAQLIWVSAFILAILGDCWMILFTIAQTSIVGFVGIGVIHLTLLPMVRIGLECAINVERIAKRCYHNTEKS